LLRLVMSVWCCR